jgi:hypothetical protein
VAEVEPEPVPDGGYVSPPSLLTIAMLVPSSCFSVSLRTLSAEKTRILYPTVAPVDVRLGRGPSS